MRVQRRKELFSMPSVAFQVEFISSRQVSSSFPSLHVVVVSCLLENCQLEIVFCQSTTKQLGQ